MHGNLARRHARAAQGSAQELMRKSHCMGGIIVLVRLQTHSSVIPVLAKVTNFYTLPSPIPNTTFVSVNCTWSPWSSWDACSATCDGGTRLRSRFVKKTSQNGGSECTGGSTEPQACGKTACKGEKGWLSFHFIAVYIYICLRSDYT